MFKYVKFKKVETQNTILEFRGGDDRVVVSTFDVNIVSIRADLEVDIDKLVNEQPIEIEATYINKSEFESLVKESKQYKRLKERVATQYEDDVSSLLEKYPLPERETWTLQLEQAKAFQASGDETLAPFLKVLAYAEGDTVENFANAVLTKASEYEAFMAQALAEKRAFERRLLNEIGL